MKKLILILLLLIIVPFAYADWFYNSQDVTTNIDISSYADIEPLTTRGYIESATVNLTFFPKETENQEIINFHTNPEAEVTEKTAQFKWKRPYDRIDFRITSDVKARNTINQVREKIEFPIEDLPSEIIPYTKPSQTIDSNDEDIIRLASELVKGEDDLYFAVYKIAEWTKNNIEYNLSTLTADVSQKASWVLQNKQGVCDELTSLFIALLRAVGIPARFTSGIAYTNSELFPEKWGAHGWAEVYFPEYGWIPFDVTYGEFGWTDPTHVKFKDSVDSDEASTYYQWLGRDADLKTHSLDIKTNLIEAKGDIKPPIKVESSVLKKAIGFGSYNLVEANIENLGDFYYATELVLSKSKEVKIIGNEFRSVILLPKETKKVYWIIKVDNNLNNRYSYTFLLSISTVNNVTSETSLESSVRDSYVSFEEVEQIAKLLDEEKEKKYSGNVLLDCQLQNYDFYEYQNPDVSCTAKNTGNIFLEDAEACFDGKCNKTEIGISQIKHFTFKIDTSRIGQNKIPFTLRNGIVSKTYYVEFKINDKPDIEIEDLVFPINASYEKNFTVSFNLAKKSQSNPQKVVVAFSQNGIEKKWLIEELAESSNFVLNIEGSQLRSGKNDYSIDVSYVDGLKKHYSKHKEFSINLTNATIMQRLFLSINLFEGMSNESIAIILMTGTIAFIGVVLILFRQKKR